MNIELLIIGNEILIGKTQDTNSYWITKRVTKYGHEVNRITTIRDDVEIISKVLRNILERKPDIIITTGGLGPTFDDLTLKGIAEGLNRELKLDENAYESIKTAYENAYEKDLVKLKEMTKEREKMAYLPEGGIPLPNLRGTAPGVKLEEKGILIFVLPGVPNELKGMFNRILKPFLKKERGKFVEKGFSFSEVGESQIAPYVTEMEEKHPDLWIKTHPKVGLAVKVEISITCFNKENCEKEIDKVLKELKETVKDLGGKIQEEHTGINGSED
jgi:nicotinamide-nucleotide amidase